MTYISGRVIDREGRPLRWVGVILDPRTNQQAVSLTNKDGRFAFRTTPGNHKLAVRNYSLRPFTEDYQIGRNGIEGLEITLQPSLRMLDYPSGFGINGQ